MRCLKCRYFEGSNHAEGIAKPEATLPSPSSPGVTKGTMAKSSGKKSRHFQTPDKADKQALDVRGKLVFDKMVNGTASARMKAGSSEQPKSPLQHLASPRRDLTKSQDSRANEPLKQPKGLVNGSLLPERKSHKRTGATLDPKQKGATPGPQISEMNPEDAVMKEVQTEQPFTGLNERLGTDEGHPQLDTQLQSCQRPGEEPKNLTFNVSNTQQLVRETQETKEPESRYFGAEASKAKEPKKKRNVQQVINEDSNSYQQRVAGGNELCKDDELAVGKAANSLEKHDDSVATNGTGLILKRRKQKKLDKHSEVSSRQILNEEASQKRKFEKSCTTEPDDTQEKSSERDAYEKQSSELSDSLMKKRGKKRKRLRKSAELQDLGEKEQDAPAWIQEHNPSEPRGSREIQQASTDPFSDSGVPYRPSHPVTACIAVGLPFLNDVRLARRLISPPKRNTGSI